MEKVITAGIGGRSFTINENAYGRLDSYLNNFRAHLKDVSKDEVMDGNILLLFRIKSPRWRPGLVFFVLWLISVIAFGTLTTSIILSGTVV